MKKKESLFDLKFIDELAKKYPNPEDIFGKDGLFKQIQKALLERMLNGELTTELGYEKTVLMATIPAIHVMAIVKKP